MKCRVACAGLVLCFLLTGLSAGTDNQTAVEQARVAAQLWLQLVDEGHYRRSYKDASSYFQSRIGEQQWVASVEPVRKPLGAVVSRQLERAEYTNSLPGAPDGQYVVITYETSFRNKHSAVETVTPMLDKDGKWRVSGYYIR